MENHVTAELQNLQKLTETLIEYVVKYAFQVLGALIILIVGYFVARAVGRLIVRLCQRHDMDVTLTRFFSNITRFVVLVFVVIIAMGKFGISIAPFIAALGALAFGSSFAFQGPLSNFGAGLTIILTRPFVVGNTLAVLGVSGLVDEITLTSTILITEDGEKITIPNKHIVGEIITNSFENRIVETSIGISYADDPERAVALIATVLASFEQVAAEPAPQIGIEEFADSAISIGMRYWVPTTSYFQTLYAVNQAVYTALKGAGITIPFPQQDIYIKEQAPSG
ncbi:MAG: mechanosensitive ion channel family protein [Deltaproteobacteria bacterium]|nr:mechanosensitive ion channel family protein [Candidatus Anaeroferrophillacea bacterium]